MGKERSSEKQVLIVIPARWASSRFPGKPLHQIAGKAMLQHVWEKASQVKAAHRVIIATDDSRIAEAAVDFGVVKGDLLMTDPAHPSGTDRCAEVAKKLPEYELIINVQGDEPLIDPSLIDELAEAMLGDSSNDMVTAAAVIKDQQSAEDSNIVKVVLDDSGRALYFSRSLIPHYREQKEGQSWLRHLGLYGYRRDFLLGSVKYPPTALEEAESLEQLRALHYGARIAVILTEHISPGIDTPEQAAALEKQLNSENGDLI